MPSHTDAEKVRLNNQIMAGAKTPAKSGVSMVDGRVNNAGVGRATPAVSSTDVQPNARQT